MSMVAGSTNPLQLVEAGQVGQVIASGQEGSV